MHLKKRVLFISVAIVWLTILKENCCTKSELDDEKTNVTNNEDSKISAGNWLDILGLLFILISGFSLCVILIIYKIKKAKAKRKCLNIISKTEDMTSLHDNAEVNLNKTAYMIQSTELAGKDEEISHHSLGFVLDS